LRDGSWLLGLVARHDTRSSLRTRSLGLSLCRSLRSSLPDGLLDSVPGHLCRRVLLGEEIEVLLRNGKLSMGRRNIGVLDILGVKRAKFPVRLFGLLCVLELDDLTEDSDLLDQILE